MGLLKRWLEDLSVGLGHDGEINAAVLAEAAWQLKKHASQRFLTAVETYGPGSPESRRALAALNAVLDEGIEGPTDDEDPGGTAAPGRGHPRPVSASPN